MMKKLTKLEGLRGFCALYIIIYHTYGYYKPLVIGGIDFTILTKFGDTALVSFFILSGIVISYSYEQSKDQSFKLYFFKRFFRIYIPLVFVFILNYVIFKFKYGDFNIPITHVIGNLLMLQDIPREGVYTIVPPLMMNDPLWTLSYEWWFYMFYFLIMKYFRKNSTTVAISIFTIGSIAHIIYPNTLTRILMLMSIWWVGVVIARLYIADEKINFKSMKLPLLGIVISIGTNALNMFLYTKGITSIYPIYDVTFIANTLFLLAIGYTWYKMKWIGYNKVFSIFVPFASISYVLYAIHWFMICWAVYLDNVIANYRIRYVAYILIAMLCAYIIERKIYPPANKYFMRKIFPEKYKLKT